MIYIIAIFQSHCRSEYKQTNLNKIKRDIYKSDNILSYLQSITVFNLFLNNGNFKTEL